MNDASTPPGQEVRVLRPPRAETAKQDIPVFFGISERTAGANGLSLNVTAFPPGGHSNTHKHADYETAIYAVDGAIEFFHGERLEHSLIARTGDFLFIPAGVPHKTYNLSLTEPATFVTARNDPREQENVILTPEADDGSCDERVARTRERLADGER
ncbi:cupin domain-containing protein [Capillimicrobium parvum]|uniref:Cupin type-2 domain-containing protein n=1 Tax=Capillimicrobium parvum TaxID=2884022 RepID=A0A9E6XY10_9ACTN|nr:cupin domain-containing protein [Capillimicrobium parvum]UGS35887.1 hypothetical protein DSM104329_02284 [Capillimicrobium parvum]